jgi:1,4-dihydroxy-2-naphthoyl-CoA hydrolase
MFIPGFYFMAIWFNKEFSIQQLSELEKGTMSQYVGIEWLEAGDDFLKARMPVDHRTTQPYGFLHGGASCVLAETIGSIASAMVIDNSRFYCVGIEINANHIRSAKQGYVTGTCTPLHLGSSTHVWDIRINDNAGKLVCISRLTVAVLAIKDQASE